MRFTISLVMIMLLVPVTAQDILPPLQKNKYSKTTSFEELSDYLSKCDAVSSLMTVEKPGKSVAGRNIYSIKFSASDFGNDSSKIKVLILAQQHGNEQSGKEGALLLVNELLKPGNRYLLDRIDLIVIPQVNPDGSEVNRRENENGRDLNRNHLILTEPETITLHRLFDKYLFEVTLDVHEYYPYGESWKKYGYRRNSDETLGSSNNINVAQSIKDLSNNGLIPFMATYFAQRKIIFSTYCPGGPPAEDYMRNSTFDINDGRQSFAIQNTFSFIQEGKNGEDNFTDGIKQRAEGQLAGMMGLLEYAYNNCSKIKKIVSGERGKLIKEGPGRSISIQSCHVKNGIPLKLPVFSYLTKTDSLIEVDDYRPIVKSIADVSKPAGYLIPKRLVDITEWVERQGLSKGAYKKSKGDIIEQYEIIDIDSIDFEHDMVIDPNVVASELKGPFKNDDYIFIPTSQLKGNMIVLALEPKSMLGLVTYKDFAHLIIPGSKYPVLRVVNIN